MHAIPTMRRLLAASTCLAVAVTLTACEAIPQAKRNIGTVSAEVDERLAQLPPREKITAIDPVTASRDVWVGGESVLYRNGDRLPAAMDRITLNSVKPLTLDELAAAIMEAQGVRVTVELVRGIGGAGSGGEAHGEAAHDMERIMASDGLPQAPSWNSGGIVTSADLPAATKTLVVGRYNGLLSSLLDRVSSTFDVAWTYRNGEIVISDTVTKTFTVAAPPTGVKVSTGLKTGATSSSGEDNTGVSGSSSQSTEVVMQSDVWGDIKDAMENALPEDGFSRYSVSPSTRTVTVSTSPARMRVVERIIENYNAVLSRQVAINVKLVTLRFSRSEDYGVDLAGLFRGLTEKYTLNWVGPASATIAGAGELVAGVISDNGSKLSRFNGSEIAVKALAQRGEVVQVRESTVLARNGQAVPVHQVQEQPYVASVTPAETSEDSDGSTTPTITPGVVTYGYTLSVMPTVLDSGDVIVDYAIDLSNLEALDEFEAGGGYKIQQPRRNIRSFYNSVRMHSGETLVMTGLNGTDDEITNTGTGHSSNFLLGGGRQGSTARQATFIMLSPVVVKTGVPDQP